MKNAQDYLVSVLMTAYNREAFIGEAIESVLASIYRNWELIIVDDASSDQTVRIAKSYAAKDNRIHLYQNSTNLGDYPNRNRAASLAKGAYLKFVDSDDKLLPESLSLMVDSMEQCPEAGVGISDFTATALGSYPKVLSAREAYLFHYHQRPIFFASPGQAIFRKSAFDEVGGFLGKRMVSDFDMWHKIALRSPLVLLPPNLYWVRRHEGQEVTEQKRYILDYERIKIQYLLEDISPLTEKEASAIFKKRQLTVAKIFFRKLVSLQWEEAKLRAKVFFFYLFHDIKQQNGG